MWADHPKRTAVVYIGIIMIFTLLFFRLFILAQTDIAPNVPSISGQYTNKLPVTERRGFILDRTGTPLAGFEDGYVSLIDPSKLKRPVEDATAELAKYSSLSADELGEKIKKGVPFTLKTSYNLKNEYVTSFPFYKRNEESTGSLAAHIIGYLNSEGTGMTGIEKAFNGHLNSTGASVSAIYESDALRRSFSGIDIQINDENYLSKTGITLTLDSSLQRKAEEIADSSLTKGAILVMNSSDGEILASVSRPVYDINSIAQSLNSESGEFLNRAFIGFTPGSFFKTVVAAAALEMNLDFADFTFDCTGEIDVFGQKFRCYNNIGHGENNMTGAYAKSCNCYFITLALKIGYGAIYDMAKKMGIGGEIYLDGLSVSSGNIEDRKSPPPAYAANAAIGQGDLLVTPLEAVRIMSSIANGGKLPNATIVRSMNYADHTTKLHNLDGDQILSSETISLLQKMTKQCVTEGTGILANPQKGGAGGKTSSAESGQYIYINKESDDTLTEVSQERVQVVHSWFVGYYPAENPKFTIAVIVEGGVTDGIRATEIFAQVCDYIGGVIYR